MPIKIFLVDQNEHKTTSHLKAYWETDPRFILDTDMYFNPLKAEWADYIWIEWCEGTIVQASARKGGINEFNEVRLQHIIQPARNDYDWSKAKIINRMIDIDVYYGHYRAVQWQNVDHLAYIARHIYDIADKEMNFKDRFPNLKTTHIPLSINLNEYNFRKRDGSVKKLAWINHIWTGKGLPTMLQAFKALCVADPTSKWELHIAGYWSNEQWLRPYINHIISEMGLVDQVKIYDWIPNVNDFLESFDYVVSSSFKEAFSLIAAESMAKGIKMLTHNWLGAKDIWPESCVWTTIDEFVAKILANDYNSEYYRELASKYDKKYEIKAANKLMNLI